MRDAVVIAREDTPGDKRLVAYYTPAEGAGPVEVELLRAHLSSTLPEYMVPAAYVALDLLPLTPNGKLDRKALPAPGQEAYLTQSYEAPRGDVETALAEIWAEVLKLDRVGRQDNFFSLGGHSLLAVTLIERMRRVGLQVDVRSLFSASTPGHPGCSRPQRYGQCKDPCQPNSVWSRRDHSGDAASGPAHGRGDQSSPQQDSGWSR